MELRDLEYFMAIAREESITGAANALNLSQPALTRSLKLLEVELGKQLVIRGKRRATLTEDGMLLRRRAADLLQLADRTKEEIMWSDGDISGDIYVCAGETRGLHYITKAAKRLMDRHPDIRFHISSGDTDDVVEELEKGLIDFGLMFDPIDATQYEYIPIPYVDNWGVIMRKDAPLAGKASIRLEDLIGKPLIVPRNADVEHMSGQLFGVEAEKLRVVGTYSLIFNAGLMATDGIGYVLGLDQILTLTGETTLTFRPLEPAMTAHMNVVWRRYRTPSRAAAALLKELQDI